MTGTYAAPVQAVSVRMRIGDALVDVSTREIATPQARRPKRITPKAMGVLCVLAASPGQVVGRGELLSRVWPDTMPTDDVLTQAVTQLRKAFGADGKRYIETIAKNGYRLVAPVEGAVPDAALQTHPRMQPSDAPLDASGSTGASAARPPPLPPDAGAVRDRSASAGQVRPGRWRAPLLVTAGVLAAFGLGAVAWMLVGEDAVPGARTLQGAGTGGVGAGRPYRLITSAPGFELSPTLSPDASMVAYSANVPGRDGSVIQVQPTTVAQPRHLTRPSREASDTLPAWSPDGREIAFARRWLDGRCMVMIAAANGAGPEREVVGCHGSDLLSFSWTPDRRGLLFGTMTGSDPSPGIRLFDLSSGQWRAIAYEANGGIDYAPQFSPDGRWIAFVRNPQLGDLWRIPADGGAAEQLTEVGAEIRGWSWLPDGESLVFGRRIDSGTRLYRLDIGTEEVNDLDLEDAQGPEVSAQTGALAFVHRRPRFGIHRIERGPDGAPVGVERLFESSGRDALPSISPDGRQLVFASDRTGHFELWWANLANSQSLRPIEGLHPDARQLPIWSPDGRSLLVSGRDESDRPVVYEVVPATGQAAPLPIPAERPLHAAYLPDSSRLLVNEETRDNGARLVLYDRGSRPWRELRAIEDVSQVRVDVDGGRVVFTRLSGDGLWQVAPDLSPDSIRSIDGRMPSRWHYRTWAIAGNGGIDYLDRSGDCPARLHRLAGAGMDAHCLDAERLAGTNGFSADPRTGDLYVSLAVEDGTDIAFLAEPERIARSSTRLAKWLKRMVNSFS